jgi:outer membrane protein TolC
MSRIPFARLRIWLLTLTFVLSLAGILMVSSCCVAEDAEAEEGEQVFTLEECLRRALEANLSLSAQALDIGIAEQGVVSAMSTFDSRLGLDLLYEDTRRREEFSGSDSGRGNLSWSKRIRSGQEFRVSHAFSRLNRESELPLSALYDMEWTISAFQPLAKGAGRTANMAPVWIAGNQEKTSLLTTEEAIADLVQAVEVAYLNFAYAIRYLEVQRSGLNLAKELLAKNRELVRIGKLPGKSIDVVGAEASIAVREEGVILALNDIAKAEDAIRRLLNLPVQFEQDRQRLLPADEALQDVKLPTVEESLAFSIAHRPKVKALELQVDTAGLELAASRNNLLPQVDLRADLGFSGSDGSYGSSFDQLAEGEDTVWQVGLSVSYPWGNRAARSRHVQAKLNYERSRILLNDFLEQLRLDVVNVHRDLDTDIKRVASTAASVKQAELQLQTENERQEQGMSDSFRIVQYQSDLIEARSRQLAARIDFNTSYYNLLRIEGRAMCNERFDLTDLVEKILRQVQVSPRR